MARPLSRLPSSSLCALCYEVRVSRRAISCAFAAYDHQPMPQRLQIRHLHPSNSFITRIALPSYIHGQTNAKRLFSTTKSPKVALRKHIRPFLIACHPDASHFADEDNNADPSKGKKKHMSRQAKAVNLKAVQTINGLIDICDELITRCTSTSVGQLPELKASYEVEFMLPSSATPSRTGELRIKHKKRREELSLRSVVIEFPARLREDVRQMALTRGSNDEEAHYTGMRLKKHVEKELGRLLIVAGLEYEGTSDEEEEDFSRGGQERKEEGEWTLSDHFLHELGIEPMEDIAPKSSAFYGRNRPAQTAPPGYSHLKEERQKFVNSIKWDTFRELYDEAYEDAQADIATARMDLYNPNTKEGRDRREQLVSEICSRVEIWMGDNEDAEIPEGLDVVAQLVALRRLSSVLLDNFEYFKMEEMGRMWENLTIVLTPPRDGRRRHKKHNPHDEYADVARTRSPHPGRKLNKWERRMKKRERTAQPDRGFMRRVAESHFNTLNKKMENDDINESFDQSIQEEKSTESSSPSHVSESGFKFSYGNHGTGSITVYIPIDFGDVEIKRQLHVYLYDYFDSCSGSGFLTIAPDGTLTANATGLDEDDDMTVAN